MRITSRRVFNCLDTFGQRPRFIDATDQSLRKRLFHGLASCEFALRNNPTTRADGCRAFTDGPPSQALAPKRRSKMERSPHQVVPSLRAGHSGTTTWG